MKVFVTGGTGFVGKPTVERLVQGGHEVRCLVRRTSSTGELEALGCELTHGDVTDEASVLERDEGVRVAVNLANLYSWWEPDKGLYRRVNVQGTRNVMEAALEAGVSKAVHVSTFVVWGKPLQIPFDERTPEGPERFTEYARTKHEGDLLVWEHYRERDLPVVVLYPGAVLGPEDPKSTGQYVRDLVERRVPARIFEDSAFTFVHVDDVAEAIVRALEKEGNLGEKYLIGKHALTMSDVNRMVSEISGVPLPKMRPPRPGGHGGSGAHDEGCRPERQAAPLRDVHGHDEEHKGECRLRREQVGEGAGPRLHANQEGDRGGGLVPPKVAQSTG